MQQLKGLDLVQVNTYQKKKEVKHEIINIQLEKIWWNATFSVFKGLLRSQNYNSTLFLSFRFLLFMGGRESPSSRREFASMVVGVQNFLNQHILIYFYILFPYPPLVFSNSLTLSLNLTQAKILKMPKIEIKL